MVTVYTYKGEILMHSYYRTGIEGIDQLHINKMPHKRKVEIEACVQTKRGTLFRTKQGTLYSSNLQNGYMIASVSDLPVFEACVLLGVLSQEDYDEFAKLATSLKSRRTDAYNADRFVEYAELIDLKLTKTQQRKVETLQANAPGRLR